MFGTPPPSGRGTPSAPGSIPQAAARDVIPRSREAGAHKTAVASPPHSVHLVGLRKQYGTVQAVDGVDLAIAAGEIVALLGPNGAGKSTTIDMLLGLTRPDDGEVRLYGESPQRACTAGRVGAMLQNGGLLPEVSVGRMLESVRALYPRALPVREVLARAGVSELADARTNRLSGGQRQRVRFALALLPDPDLIVLDEPTAAMDVESRRAFWTAMRTWAAAGRTVLFATHYLEEADDFADRIVLLRRGQVIADGPTTEVKALVGGRTIRATLHGLDDAVLTGLARLPGVARVDSRGASITLTCPDSDTALRALLAAYPTVEDIEVVGAGLEDAFVALTSDDSPEIRPAASRQETTR
ncbi:ABC-type multidrug transport system, ATPase component [Frankia canadensis]|uniref:ABC-type multidrug transport system, ATPase component n=1 Tax=Frankia canadensis TaxID=1836972 RepID=A0A2I2KKQ7_9ACTN|nr:ABC transporter ATP-binding protein [Frankia canadensis]SNQ46243.1 ABC-type multidrug transport system, ATPase component [Frankia canadensis]SOU53533.1 ABC-type multidrug transport system, ATPase component [Frankia canadensis]